MPINRQIWKASFAKDNIPQWQCPTCNVGWLEMKEGSFTFSETAESINLRKMDDWEYEWIGYSYVAVFICSNRKCKAEISSCGSGGVDLYVKYDESGDIEDYSYSDYFVPEYFVPSLSVFSIPDSTPNEVAKAIRSSFKLYFSSSESALNQIRISVENLLTHEGVKRFSRPAKKYISLHHRIEIYEKKNPKVGKQLLALKNLGNAGSHMSTVTKDDVLDAYSILEIVLNELYSNQSKQEIEKIIKHINKGKGPIKNRMVIDKKRRS